MERPSHLIRLTEPAGEHTEAGLNYWVQKLKWPQAISMYSRPTHRFIVPTFLPELFKVDTQANRPHWRTQELWVGARKAGEAKVCFGVSLLITGHLKGMCAWIRTHELSCITSNKSFTPCYSAVSHRQIVSVVVGHLPCVKLHRTKVRTLRSLTALTKYHKHHKLITWNSNYHRNPLSSLVTGTWIMISVWGSNTDITQCCILAH